MAPRRILKTFPLSKVKQYDLICMAPRNHRVLGRVPEDSDVGYVRDLDEIDATIAEIVILTEDGKVKMQGCHPLKGLIKVKSDVFECAKGRHIRFMESLSHWYENQFQGKEPRPEDFPLVPWNPLETNIWSNMATVLERTK